MKGPTPRHLWIYVTRCLGLRSYFQSPGDGRPQPQIPAKALLWSLLIGQVLRASPFLAVERLVRSSARRVLLVSKSFSDDTLGYFTERLDPAFTRIASAQVLRKAKRNKAGAPLLPLVFGRHHRQSPVRKCPIRVRHQSALHPTLSGPPIHQASCSASLLENLHHVIGRRLVSDQGKFLNRLFL